MNKRENATRDGDFIRGTTWDGKPAKGDLIFETCQHAMFHRDYAMLNACKLLLIKRRRWPKRMDEPDGIEHRNPRGMTRDPYYMFWVACVEMDRVEWIAEVKPPWYIWRPNFWAFRRFLINPTKRNRRRWERAEWLSDIFSPMVPMFAIYLGAWAAWIAYSEKVMARIRPKVPTWNLAIRQLVLDPDRVNDEQAIADFLPRTGFIWQMEPRRPDDLHYIDNPKFLPLDQEYYLDWDALTYIHERNQERGNNPWS